MEELTAKQEDFLLDEAEERRKERADMEEEREQVLAITHKIKCGICFCEFDEKDIVTCSIDEEKSGICEGCLDRLILLNQD